MPNSKTHIIVASKHALYRLGLKYVLTQIGIDAELKMLDSFPKLKDAMVDAKVNFVILSEDVLVGSDDLALSFLNDDDSGRQILLIGDRDISKYDKLCYINQNLEQDEMTEQLRGFFFDRYIEEADQSVLTDREIEVLRKVAQGYANKEIADKLFISINTVITHRKNITEKLGIKTIAGLTVYALMNNIIMPEEVQY